MEVEGRKEKGGKEEWRFDKKNEIIPQAKIRDKV
jgi:hypothetical protein